MHVTVNKNTSPLMKNCTKATIIFRSLSISQEDVSHIFTERKKNQFSLNPPISAKEK
jgi:hypothetical protein